MKNIGGDKNDVFYRYKRNTIQTEKIDKQGGLTKITNMQCIQRQLGVGKDFISLFYKAIKKTGHPQVSTGVFRGNIPVDVLENILEKLIQEHVLCPKCKLPEWNKEVCKACGYCKDDESKKAKLKKSKKKLTKQQVELESDADDNKTETQEIVNDNKLKDLYKERETRIEKGLDCKEIDNLINKFWK